jgi:hypothetical protein
MKAEGGVKVMTKSRRSFLAASAAIGVVGASDAFAQDATPWIGWLHSTALEPDLEQSFLEGLRNKGWEGDPTQPVSGARKRVIIRRVNGNGKYKSNNVDDLKRGASDLREHTSSNLKMLIAGGGIVSGLAAADVRDLPLLVILGRFNQTVADHGRVGGFLFDRPYGANQNDALIAKYNYLTNPATYAIRPEKICLLYNGNSSMGSAEASEWLTNVNRVGKSLDAKQSTSGAVENNRIVWRRVFDDANAALGSGRKAIILSSDPFFTSKRQRIIKLAQQYDGLVMCYPLQEYYDDAVEPDTDDRNRAMSFGPRLKTVYSDLGGMAGQLLTTPDMSLTLRQAGSTYSGL